MESLIDEIQKIFDFVAIKKVSKTDVAKDAYVLDKSQQEVMERAGMTPGRHASRNIPHIKLHVLMTDKVLEATYYESIRKDPKRTPERRMGIFIKKFKVGDSVLLATDGERVYIHKVGGKDKTKIASNDIVSENAQKIYRQLSPRDLLRKAKSAPRKPKKKLGKTSVYERDGAVVEYVRLRSGFRCETEGCDYEGFLKGNGEKFIEVHHLTQLAEGGEDSIRNAAAVCPNCHRSLHYSKNKKDLKKVLQRVVLNANKQFEDNN